MPIADKLFKINEFIYAATEKSGRERGAVKLVAVSKTKSATDIATAFKSGQRLFGENYIQEIIQKLKTVEEPVQWHFIGHLQSNKVKYIAGKVSLIHSVDRISLVEEIDRQWGKLGEQCDILIQVNISAEASKSGTTRDGALKLIREASLFPNVKVKGLMTMPPFFDNPELARPYFAELKRLSDIIANEQIEGVQMRELSMGMSGDFEVAIEEGSTLVRIGKAIFGER